MEHRPHGLLPVDIRKGHRVAVAGVIRWVVEEHSGYSSPNQHWKESYPLTLVEFEDGSRRHVKSDMVVRAQWKRR